MIVSSCKMAIACKIIGEDFFFRFLKNDLVWMLIGGDFKDVSNAHINIFVWRNESGRFTNDERLCFINI